MGDTLASLDVRQSLGLLTGFGWALGGSGEIFSELGLQLVDLADVLSELGVGGALADAG
jgi:hypothetical protein